MTTPLPPRHRCPWFLSGLALGLALGLACIHHGLTTPPPGSTAQQP